MIGAISKNREKERSTCIFILTQDSQNEGSFFTRESLPWEDREILCLSFLFLHVLF